MKTRQSSSSSGGDPASLPDADSLAALRAWYEGIPAREAVALYLGQRKADGVSSRGILSRVRGQLVACARRLHREDLASLFVHAESERATRARAVAKAIALLPTLVPPVPLIGDDVAQWLPPRAAQALHAHGIKTLAALTVRIPRRRRWWVSIPGLGAASARHIEAFFAAHPQLTERARALVVVDAPEDVVPWERIVVPNEVDGSRGTFRAPRATCTLSANNDYDAVHAWLALHESPATQRAYRKEAERLILWAVLERGRALSSLTTEDGVVYRAFLRQPAPRARWVGPSRPRSSPEWKPFAGGLSARSAAYALTVLGALYRWLMQQRYVLANPFAGIKVRGATRAPSLAATRAFSDAEWNLIRTVADGLEWSYGWEAMAAQRLRFLLDFAYGTGLRASELVGAKLRQIETDEHGDHWLHVIGKGSKAGKVTLPPLAWGALLRYLAQRRLPTTSSRWKPDTPLLGSLDQDSDAGITSARLWNIVRRFFATAAEVIGQSNPATVDKLLRASPHWMRHTHASHSLARGAELTSVRDNLRHASLSTTSIYLHGDEIKRARQLREAFAARA
ncbi:MAG: integrase [Flavobacteriales bacterium]|nr:MAG: integrase [Flavobacteriales bacterium]